MRTKAATTSKWIVPALAMAMFVSTAAAHAQYGPQGPPPNGYGQGPGGPGGPGGWDAPPPAFRDAQQRGYRDGVEGARRDVQNHRPPNVNNRDEYRHPSVPRDLRRDYKDGFRQGYNVAIQHMLGGPGRRPY